MVNLNTQQSDEELARNKQFWYYKRGSERIDNYYGPQGFIRTSDGTTTLTNVLDEDLCHQHLLSHLLFDWIMQFLFVSAESDYTEVHVLMYS